MRQQKLRKQTNEQVIASLGRSYNRLLKLCQDKIPKGYGCYSVEDIVGETIIFVSQDSKAIGLDDARLADWFMYRFDMVRFQISKDIQLLKEKQYADYMQDKETEE